MCIRDRLGLIQDHNGKRTNLRKSLTRLSIRFVRTRDFCTTEMCIRDRNKTVTTGADGTVDVQLMPGVYTVTEPVSYTHLDVYKRQTFNNTELIL